jgi:V8-like Glu-specific endopeptidase
MQHSTWKAAGLVLTLLVPLSCGPAGDVQPGSSQTQSSIVHGTTQPTVVPLSAPQNLAIGAVMDNSGGGGFYNICTGTLVADKVVLTAAHCVVDGDGVVSAPSTMGFAVGPDAAHPTQLSTVTQVFVHEGYNAAGMSAHNDLAILVLRNSIHNAEPLPFNCNTLAGSGLVGQAVQAVGYGDTRSSGSNNTRKFFASEDVVSIAAYDLTVDGHGTAGVCSGDSGGPVLRRNNGVVQTVGVLSWGDAQCGNRDHFARTDAHCAFINSHTTAAPAPAAEGATVEGVTFDATQAAAVLNLVNTAPFSTLDVDVGLDSRAASNIVAARPLESLQALGAVSYVGTSALTLLLNHVR